MCMVEARHASSVILCVRLKYLLICRIDYIAGVERKTDILLLLQNRKPHKRETVSE